MMEMNSKCYMLLTILESYELFSWLPVKHLSRNSLTLFIDGKMLKGNVVGILFDGIQALLKLVYGCPALFSPCKMSFRQCLLNNNAYVSRVNKSSYCENSTKIQ